MILFKKCAMHKVKSSIHCINQSLRENAIKNEAKNINKNSHFCLIFNRDIIDLLISRTEKIA